MFRQFELGRRTFLFRQSVSEVLIVCRMLNVCVHIVCCFRRQKYLGKGKMLQFYAIVFNVLFNSREDFLFREINALKLMFSVVAG